MLAAGRAGIPFAISSMSPLTLGLALSCWCWDGCTIRSGTAAPACWTSSAPPGCHTGSIPCSAPLLAAGGHGAPQAALFAGLPLVLLSAFIPGMGAGALVLVLGFYGGSLALMTLAVPLLLGWLPLLPTIWG